MGCLTGFVAKIILTAGNIAVAIAGVIVITLSALVQTYITDYGEDVLTGDTNTVLIGLETVAALVICLGAFGMLVSCCCQNKLFLYTYLALGSCLVIAVLTFGIMGQANIDKYSGDTANAMIKSYSTYNFSNDQDPNNAVKNDIFTNNECCGVWDKLDWKNGTLNTQTVVNYEVPLGCCREFAENPDLQSCVTSNNNDNVWPVGCYYALTQDVNDVAQATAAMGIVFGLLLLALLGSTCFCVKCTEAMPI